eukprot:jgi/Phyca11/121179/e_gw1.43.143.1
MIALSQRVWLDDPDKDDPNLCESDCSSEATDIEHYDTIAAMLNGMDDDAFYEDVDDEDWVPREEDHDDPDFMSGEALEEVAASWKVYDETHSEEIQLNGATDLYAGRHNPTESARAFGDSLLGSFYYFMPKLLWIKIAEESNRYRESKMNTVAVERQQRQRRLQVSNPSMRLQSLEEIKDELRKSKPSLPHELV